MKVFIQFLVILGQGYLMPFGVPCLYAFGGVGEGLYE